VLPPRACQKIGSAVNQDDIKKSDNIGVMILYTPLLLILALTFCAAPKKMEATSVCVVIRYVAIDFKADQIFPLPDVEVYCDSEKSFDNVFKKNGIKPGRIPERGKMRES
jgi:hypothetical protein